MLKLTRDQLIERAKQIRLVVLDVDGVLASPQLCFSEDGETLKPFDVRDGLGVRLLIESGISVAVITARSSKPLERRISDLRIPHFYAKCANKLETLAALAEKLGLALSQICFMGDDLFDVPCLKVAGLSATVSDARPCAAEFAHFVANCPGGFGAVRDLADLILDAQFGLAQVHERFLEGEFRRARLDSQPASMVTPPPFTVVIPARYASTRLPGKPLIMLRGIPMIERVCQNAERSLATRLCVATDDERIKQVVTAAGYEAIMTSTEHASGTDRLAEVVSTLNLPPDSIVVNVQGDEPLLNPELIDKMALSLALHRDAGIATVATPISSPKDLFCPNIVKVTLSARSMALYFSRAPIPWARGHFEPSAVPETLPTDVPYLRHVGLYGYRACTILKIASEAKAACEQAESLEQLRALWLGIGIHVSVVADPPGHGVDTPDYVERVEALLTERATIPVVRSTPAGRA